MSTNPMTSQTSPKSYEYALKLHKRQGSTPRDHKREMFLMHRTAPDAEHPKKKAIDVMLEKLESRSKNLPRVQVITVSKSPHTQKAKLVLY